MAWITDDAMVGQRVLTYDFYGEQTLATVLAVSDHTANIKVRADNGDILIGNTFDDA